MNDEIRKQLDEKLLRDCRVLLETYTRLHGPAHRCAACSLLSRLNTRFGVTPKHPGTPLPLPGEVTLKEWCFAEAKRSGSNARAIYERFADGKYPDLRTRRVNSRVIFVATQ
jgi:hypothetical protein